LILGIVAIIIGLVMKINTEKCEITVTDNRIFGKLKGGADVDIPLNQITGIHACSFNGISVSSIGKVSNFYLMSNREEIMKGISYLLANGKSQIAPTTPTVHPASETMGDIAKIKQCKELLDTGVISQEEFEEKKKQILGL
jgi:predicted ABC-type sugar transport system permease subunit